MEPSGPPVAEEDLVGIRHALRLAAEAERRGEVPVGAAVIAGGVLLGEGHNECRTRGDPTAHAELLAIQRALAASGSDRLLHATLYLTLEPCAQCAGAIVLAKLGRVVFAAADPKAGMAGSVGDLLRHPALNHRPEVRGGVLAQEAGELLQRFFAARRDPGKQGS